MDTSPHISGFVQANGIRLHYLDWGGSGPVLLFIPGMGCTAHIFDGFAPRFIDRFHVMALTRRGHGESDHPESGYDPDTLAEDLRCFLDAVQVDQVILAGHSLGYIELSRFSNLYPERVLKLVWLDAAYDRTPPELKAMMARNPLPKILPPWPAEPFTSIEAFAAQVRHTFPSLAAIWGPELEADIRANVYLSPQGKVVEKETDAINAALTQTYQTYSADYASIRTPMLSIFVLGDYHNFLSDETMTPEQQAEIIDYFLKDRLPLDQRYIETFRSLVPQARVVVIPDGHHYCFIKQAERTYQEMRAFLLEN
jgi:non-heme chloroperoxidase